MLLHLVLLCAVAIWMIKIAEKYDLGKNYCVIAGALGYIAMLLIVHFSLFIFGEGIYDNHRLIFSVNVFSGLIGAFFVSFILRKKGKRSKNSQ